MKIKIIDRLFYTFKKIHNVGKGIVPGFLFLIVMLSNYSTSDYERIMLFLIGFIFLISGMITEVLNEVIKND